MKVLVSLFFFSLLSVGNWHTFALKIPSALGSMGPMGSVILTSISNCDDVPDTEFKVTTNLKVVDSKGTKAIDLTASVPRDIGRDLKFQLTVSKWTDNGWEANAYKASGNLCEYFNKFISKLWKKASESAVPNFNPNCLIQKAEYKLTNFQAASSDIGLPAVLYGKFLLNFKIILGGKPIFCRNIEVISQK